MARRNPPAKWVLPEVVNPAARRCIKIEVPDDPAHIAAFRGAMLALQSAYNWADDTAHTAREVALVWREIIDTHLDWGCDMPIAFRQTDCGLFYSADNWETETQIYDGLLCLSSDGGRAIIDGFAQSLIDGMIADGQLGNPGRQPSPGGKPLPGSCKTYHVSLNGNGQWICPFPVNTGDTIAVTGLIGGWSDGSLAWYCGNGARYLLQICDTSLHSHQAGDPLAAAWHMALVGQHNATTPVWFDASTGIYTIPAGHTNDQLILQANDGSLGDNQGNISFDVQICTGGWQKTFDFMGGNAQSWVSIPFLGVNATIGASGWLSGQIRDANKDKCLIQLNRQWASGNAHLTHIRVVGDTTHIAEGGVRACDFGGAGVNRTSLGIDNTNGFFDVNIPINFNVHDVRVYVNTENANVFFNGHVVSITIYGDGIEPTW